MTRLLALLRLDAKLAVRHRLLAVTLAVAVAFGLLVRLFVPTELQHEGLAFAPAELPLATLLDASATKPRLDHQALLLLFALDMCLLGLMFGAVMVLEDRRTETIALHRVTPIGPHHYVLSKLLVNLALTALNYVILVGLIAPAWLAKLDLAALVLGLCAGMTLLGIALAPLARSISHFFFPLLVIGLVTSLPMFQIWSPARGLDWTRALPTWHVLFGGEALALGGERAAAQALAGESQAYALAFLLITGLLALLAVHGRLFRAREAH